MPERAIAFCQGRDIVRLQMWALMHVATLEAPVPEDRPFLPTCEVGQMAFLDLT